MLVCVLSRPFQWTCKSCMASRVLVGDCILILLEIKHILTPGLIVVVPGVR